MEKVMFLLGLGVSTNRDSWRKMALQALAPALLDNPHTKGLCVAVEDGDVAAASCHRRSTEEEIPQVCVSVWLDSANHYRQIAALLEPESSWCHAYLVTESVILEPSTEERRRTPGSMQLCKLRKRDDLSYREFIEIWKANHTDIALTTQSTTGYRQNTVVYPLDSNAPPCDAIVEEHFPEAAMNSPLHYFDAPGDPDRMQENMNRLMASCERFINRESIVVVHLSEYQVKYPEL